MKLSERSLQNPAAVAAAAAIVVLFGVLAMLRLPIQLLPDTRQPQLFVERRSGARPHLPNSRRR